MTGSQPNQRGRGRTNRDAANGDTPTRRRGPTREQSDADGDSRRSSPPADLRTVIAAARAQLQELTGRPAEAVTSVERLQDGWRLNVEVVELERIPASTSILGGYEVQVDSRGNLLEYSRTGRYPRNQASDGES